MLGREELGSTGIGHAAAIPRAKYAGTQKTVAAVEIQQLLNEADMSLIVTLRAIARSA
jgi:mannitol/fructose-specific phosphotransferase system IIA component (Ntr-type)